MLEVKEAWHVCPAPKCPYWGSSAAVQRHFGIVHASTNWIIEHLSRESANDPVRDRDGRCLKLIFRAWKIDNRGRKIWARDYGLRAWRIYVPSTK